MTTKKRYIVTTLGCRVNQSESEAISRQLEAAGWAEENGASEGALLHIINTCTVTGKAAMQSRGAIRRAVRAAPEALIVVTGCFAQTEAAAAAEIEGVHYVIGQSEKHRIPEIIGSNGNRPPKPVILCNPVEKERQFSLFPAENFISHGAASDTETGRSRPTLKIQDGCNAFCTYCIVPHARGRSRSMPIDEVMERLRLLGKRGYHEAVLSGIHLGCWGADLAPRQSLLSLLKRIQAEKPVDRVRLSSIEPGELTDEIIETVAASPRFCRHFHIPLQSGDDDILRRMGRPYTRAFFADRVTSVRKAIPDAAIGADVLVGFPGESDGAFENTCDLIESLPITYLHVFPFSPRQGTPAAGFPNPVPAQTIRKRCERLREIGRGKKEAFSALQQDRTAHVLIEGKRDPASHLLKGITSNYIPVLIDGKNYLKNKLAKVRLNTVKEKDFMMGTLLD